MPASHARERVAEAMKAPDSTVVRKLLVEGLSEWVDLSLFSGRWNLSAPE
ncbi:MAG: hypothetical protein GWN85_23910 [Gemmatimonadetes bacterium]|nr:hypothetical protein [Gemmatimonadota bacterium]NIX22380.1 hypothetical protein [Actinomycetota bacterium]